MAEQTVTRTIIIFGNSEDLGIYALRHGICEAAAWSARSVQAYLRLETPEGSILNMKKRVWKAAKKAARNMPDGFVLIDVEGGENPALKLPMAALTATGICESREGAKIAGKGTGLSPGGQDIVCIGRPGMEGTLRILEEKEAELSGRFAPAFLRQIREYAPCIDKGLEAVRILGEVKAEGLIHAGEGGIFAGLWYLAEETGGGFEIDLKKIPVLQETIEVCEHFRLNPYRLTSAGCFLAAAEDGEAVAEALRQAGLEAEVLGRLTKGNDKVIRNGEEIRYLDRPAPDEINRIYK